MTNDYSFLCTCKKKSYLSVCIPIYRSIVYLFAPGQPVCGNHNALVTYKNINRGRLTLGKGARGSRKTCRAPQLLAEDYIFIHLYVAVLVEIKDRKYHANPPPQVRVDNSFL